jgi:tRNA G18 (ribose-2'-O)-methylase SpoU
MRMKRFEHIRHKEPVHTTCPRLLIVACVPLRSNVNLSRIVRTATCCGVTRIIVSGKPKIDPKIARDGAESLEIEVRRSLPPVLKKMREEGYRLVGLEQTTNSENLHTFAFPEKCVLVVGNERQGLEQAVLDELDHVVEIPVYGLPFSYNVATATSMALYEYCRQFPGNA